MGPPKVVWYSARVTDLQTGRHQLEPEIIERDIARLEERLRGSLDELGALRQRFHRVHMASKARAELAEIRDEWEDVHYKWWIFVLALLLGFLLFSYFFYTNLAWYADQRSLPLSSDWLLERLPVVNVLPVLSWGWLALHAYAAGAAILYYPRKLPFLLFTLGIYLCIRTIFIFLSPIGAPQQMLDMSQLDALFSHIMGVYTFQNEFIFSGHTAIPFLFFLFFETRTQRSIMLAGSLAMAVAVLLTHNHYSVDVLSAYPMTFAIYAASRELYRRFVRPLFLNSGEREAAVHA